MWTYAIDGIVFEKRVLLLYQQNTAHLSYRLLSGTGPIRLALRPAVHFRAHDAAVDVTLAAPYTLVATGERLELQGERDIPALRLRFQGERTAFTLDPQRVGELVYRVEQRRGYDAYGHLWSPGTFGAHLVESRETTLIASTEDWEILERLAPADAHQAEIERRSRLLALAPSNARSGIAADLVLAADQFIVTPGGRPEEGVRAHAEGDEIRTVIAGYHWFTDWGRDTMISLEGLTLVTGRHREAGYILRTFARYVRDGLIPNMFPDDSHDGLYHTADATLWFFHAVARHVAATGDRDTLRRLLPTLVQIAEHHLRGTRFGIGIDPLDGLLRQGEEGYQLTWMDAKVDEWVVTPRRGKAVELNALWYNTLRLLERWLTEEGRQLEAREWGRHAEQVFASFNRRFWYADGGYLYDVVDGERGDDPACRPNQIIAIALPHPVLHMQHWQPVLETVQERLLTPFGLRSLSPDHPDYKTNYHGDIMTRDAAYHQGTVWAWLLGPFVDAWVKVHPGDIAGVRRLLAGLIEHLDDFGVGSVAEIFDAEPPFMPRGCIAQAWSVAELLRCWKLAYP